MYEFFAKLLNMSLTAGVLVITVIVLRLLLRKAPRKYVCILWALVALRLVCPVSFSSSLSVFNLIDSGIGESGQIEYFSYDGEPEEPTLNFDLVGLVDDNYSPDSMTVGTYTLGVNMHMVIYIWLFGAVVMLSYAVISYIRLRKKVSASICRESRIYVCDEIESPFILGIFSPRIYLPSGLAAETEKSVCAHEKAHLSRRDHMWKPLGYILLSVYWFNPLIWAAYILLCRDIEAACDEKVIKDMDSADIAGYSEALLACAVRQRSVTACPVAFGETDVKSRVKNVLSYRKPAFWIICVAVIICCVTAVCFLTDSNKEEQDTVVSAAESETPSTRVMRAVVTETENGTMLVEPVEGSWELGSSDFFSIPILNMEASPEPEVGDTIEVLYGGGILETYPASLENIIQMRVSEKSAEPEVVKTYKANTDLESVPDGEFVLFSSYYEMSDGTWSTGTHSYKYRLEITGKTGNAVKEITYLYLSNIPEISFHQAMMASGLSSSMYDYFDEKDAKFIGYKIQA